MYQVTLDGICAYLWNEYKSIFTRTPKQKTFDALYVADNVGNFVEEHSWLSFDGRPLRTYLLEFDQASLREDRAAHRYTFRISGSARRMSARLNFPPETLSKLRTDGAITIVVEPLPEGTPSPLHYIERDNKIMAAYDREERKANQEKKATEERTAVENKIAALQHRAHREDYLLNPDFQQKYARHHLQEISSKLKQEWASEYDAVMLMPGFKQLATKQAPAVLRWLESRVNIVRLAEQMILSPQVQKKPKLNAEQVRARIVRRDEIQAKDRIARAKLKAEKLLEAHAALEPIPLDPDAKESLRTELDQEIFDIGDEEGKNGKSGTTL